jgi:hypothetical protein
VGNGRALKDTRYKTQDLRHKTTIQSFTHSEFHSLKDSLIQSHD